MTIALLTISLLYALFTFMLWWTWLRIPAEPTPEPQPAEAPINAPFISVVIPVRNEAAAIGFLLRDLDRQTYPHFEVIVADDASTDDTRAIVTQHVNDALYPLHLLALTDEPTASPKKRAISQSIQQAKGDLIVTTDGDCRVKPGWLAAIAGFYQQTGARLISGPVTFTPAAGPDSPQAHAVFDALQTVEFASLIGSGACTMQLGHPTMCNGANLCYEKEAFLAVGGFAGVDHLASGDDELLMHKIAVRYSNGSRSDGVYPAGVYPVGRQSHPAGRHPAGIRFLKSVDAIVSTQPHRSWRAFYNQRKRWASKWRAYSSWLPTLLAVFIFLSNLAPILAVVGWWLNYLNGNVTLFVIALKVVPEFLFLRQVLVFLQKKSAVSAIPLTQFVYPAYVVFFGLAAQGKGYRWKGRNLS